MPDGASRPTVSYGISSTETDADLDAVIADADAALYRAKDLGRDRAVCSDGRTSAD
jgi:PleD family two-component response regulator